MYGNQGSGKSRLSVRTKCLYSKPIFRRTGAKLDAIFKLLLALVLMVVCVFLFQLGSGSLQISATSTPSTQLQLPTLLIFLLGLIFATTAGKLGLDDMALALAADRRERASDDLLKQHPAPSAEETKHFEGRLDFT
jgi:hypothetical protein